MKKIVTLLAISLASFYTNAQICVPGAQTAPSSYYILPDSVTNFANACPGTYYSQILYIKAAKDTTITITTPISGTITADIDSFVVDANIVGLPSYLTVESVPTALLPAGPGSPKSDFNRLRIPGDSLACAKVSGNVPMGTSPGTLNLTINLRVYTSNLHSTDLVLEALIPTFFPGRKTDTTGVIGYYKIVVEPTPCYPTSIAEKIEESFQWIGIVPNPASTNVTQVQFTTKSAEYMNMQVRSLDGKIVWQKEITSTIGKNNIEIPVSQLANGTYMCSLQTATQVKTSKMQVSR